MGIYQELIVRFLGTPPVGDTTTIPIPTFRRTIRIHDYLFVLRFRSAL